MNQNMESEVTPRRDRVWGWTAFALLAIVALTALMGLGGPAAAQGQNPTPTLSTTSPDSSPTPGRIATLDASATPGPSVTPTEAGQGGILFQDDFSDPMSGWVTADLGDIKFGYDSGALSIVLRKGNLNSHALLPNRRFDNVRIEVDVTLASGPNSSIFGILCRATASTVLEKGYELLITAGGGFGIVKVSGPNAGQSTLLGKEGQSQAIHTGNEVNHLRADCSGSRLALYANGQPLAAVQDSDWAEGQIGFAISAPSNSPGYEVHFDNLVVREAMP